MSKSRDFEIEDLYEKETIMLDDNDISICCDEQRIKDEYRDLYNKNSNAYSKAKEFLINNKKYINKEKLALILLVKMLQLEQGINENINRIGKPINKAKTIQYFLKLQGEKEKLDQSIINIHHKTIGMKKSYIYYLEYSKVTKKCRLEIYDSEEILKNKKIKNKNANKFKEIDRKFKSEFNERSGIENIIYLIKENDFYQIFPEIDMGKGIYLVTEINKALKKDNKFIFEVREIEKIREKVKELIEPISREEIAQMVKPELINYAEYIDFDKLLLIYAYRINESLENDDSENLLYYKETLKKIKNNVALNSKISYDSTEEYGSEEHVEYSLNDLKECLSRFIDDEYVSVKEINNERKLLLEGNINLSDIKPQIINLMELDYNEIEKLMDFNLENFICGTKLLNYNLNQIIEKLSVNDIETNDAVVSLYQDKQISDNDIITLYQKSIIGPEFFKEFSEEIDISSEINLSKINEEYLELKSQRNKELKNKLDAKIDIYKIINIDGKSEEEKENIANEIMYEIAETFEDEKDILYYYDKGLLTLGIIADWSGEELVGKLYSKNKIEIADLESLYEKEKISQGFLENIILNAELSLEELNNYMEKGYISEENVIKIFEEKDFYREEAERLKEIGVISQTAYEIIKNRDIKKIEERTGHKFRNLSDADEVTGDKMLYTLPLPQIEKKTDIRKPKKERNDNNYGGVSGKTNKIIDPEIRYEYLVSLKRRIPDVDYDELDRKNPFYNYEFYIIQEKCLGNIPRGDAIVIAERFFKDRKQKREYATDNATYVMRYEDYLILQGKQKEQGLEQKRRVIKEVDGAIYAVNHRVGDGDSNGSWAANVLKAIGKAKAGKSFKGLTPNEQRKEIIEWLHTLYTDKELLDILEFAEEIDEGLYTAYRGKNGAYSQTRKTGDVSDDTEARYK